MSAVETSTGQTRQALHQPGKLALFFLRGNPWPAVLWSTFLLFCAFWRLRLPQSAMGAPALPEFLATAPILMIGGRVTQLFLRSVFQGIYGLSSIELRSRRWFWPYFTGLVMFGYFAVSGRWPLGLGFAMSRSAMDRVADQALADPARASRFVGQRVGPYEIKGVQVVGETVLLYLDEENGSLGFARVPRAKTHTIRAKAGRLNDHEICDDLPNDSRSHDRVGMRVGGSWFVVYSSY